VYETLRRDVGWGETVSYGELAEMAGRPRAARAVGNAMSRNPVPIVVPCHRVVTAGGRIGGYGPSGVPTKRFLLALEGVEL
jgi:methylated-DNA-[protein]-cysteine S-methyltransferase